MQHTPVGESTAIENAIQRVQGQIRANKLDLEMNTKAKFDPSETIWPRLIKYAARPLVSCRTSGDDGLTPTQ